MGRRWRNKSRKLAAAATPPRPPWIELPDDVTANILQRLGAQELLRSARVCRTWRKVCHDPAMWRVVYLKNPHEPEYIGFSLVCSMAVNRSQGQLIDLSIACFGDDDLMNFIANRSSNLRRLTITKPYRISAKAVAEAVKKLPQLEELHLIMMYTAFADDVEAIGISCPMLKSFTLGDEMFVYLDDGPQPEEDYFNGFGLAIGATMPNLCHLRLIANQIKNKGLEAILDGCPHLESLDLRQCFGLELDLRGGALGERCSKQIKHLRLPSESIRDLEWPIEESDHDYDEYDSDEEE